MVLELGGAMMSEFTKLPRGRRCPNCGTRMDAAAFANNAQHVEPKGGDVSLCFHCGQFTIFNDDLNLRLPTPAESARLASDPEVQKAHSALLEFQRRHRQ
jgi:hypothetical protein